jgi:hypothetical protein
VTDSDRIERLRYLTEQMAEYADCVQVLASWSDEHDQTVSIKHGTGNIYARQGMAADFLEEQKARTRTYTIAADEAQAEADDQEGYDDDWRGTS